MADAAEVRRLQNKLNALRGAAKLTRAEQEAQAAHARAGLLRRMQLEGAAVTESIPSSPTPDLPADPEPETPPCPHVWPAELTPTTECLICGLPYGEWSA